MTEYRLYSWNVNGIRSTVKKGFVDWLTETEPDIVCLQETKAQENQIPKELVEVESYGSTWHSAEKRGYSGVGMLFKKEWTPLLVDKTIGVKEFDIEGRVLITKYPEFILFNVYFPNGKKDEERLDYKMRFYDHFFHYCKDLLDKDESIVVCGDVNTAHREIDLEHPKPNSKYSGFLPQERAWIDEFLNIGFIDTLRYVHGNKEKMYTWWSSRSKTAREKNVGWRLDYFFISDDLEDYLIDAQIHSNVEGSDHCPVSLTLDFTNKKRTK